MEIVAAHPDVVGLGPWPLPAHIDSLETPPRFARRWKRHGPDGMQLVRTLLADRLCSLLPTLGRIADGGCEPEDIHRARVVLRQVRVLLHECAPLAPLIGTGGPDAESGTWPDTWLVDGDEALAATARALGDLRDRQVAVHGVLDRMEEEGLAMPGLRAGLAETTPDGGALIAIEAARIVRGPAFLSALTRLIAWVDAATVDPERAGGEDPAVRPAARPRRVVRHLRRRLTRLHRTLIRDAEAFSSMDVAQRHRIRRRIKRLRYLSLLARPVVSGPKPKRLRRLLRDAQDALGESNDAAVAARVLEPLARAGSIEAAIAIGWIAGRQPALIRRGERALRRLRDVAVC